MTVTELAESFDPLGAHYDDPYPLYARARRDEPVFYSPRLDAWVVTRFADVDAVLKDPEAFSSVNSLRPIREPYPGTVAVLLNGYPQTPDHVTSDGDVHRRLRVPYTKHLTRPGQLKAREAEIRARADRLIDGFADDRSGDLIARYSTRLPVETAAELFGFAPDDVELAKAGSEVMFSLGSIDVTKEQEEQAAHTVLAFQQLLAGYARRRRAEPADDLITAVATALAPGDEPLTFDQEAELVGTFGSTFGAAHITTADGIGSALWLLLGDAEQWDRLVRQPELVPYAVEEVLRFESPIPAMFRRTTRPVTVAGVDLPAGADVLLAFASANRDEDRFPDADRFDVTRKPSRHFAFGAGIHTCVGAAMARLQMRIALQTLIERLPGLRMAPDQDVRVRRSINVRGPLALDLHW
ncbi:cytochrome P450 [Cryptosporangium phraense]|uniref:Cytochrome P450 n=1 Tax=Cryptosporangium phraense TaxID=2593070 RepID=A0A545AV87_9ACTN|nr:cytochrome P450 [Cryptosporangium phraense]TQS45248.1 cytochrome P450 [Cryptosporangium phraense]